MAPKHVLNANDGIGHFRLIGITSSSNQYEIVSLLNTDLDVQFVLGDYIPYQLKDGKMFSFSLYTFSDEVLGIDYNLVPNNSNFEVHTENPSDVGGLFSGLQVEESVKLVKELPRTDFLLMLRGEVNDHHIHRIVEKLKQNTMIAGVQVVEAGDLPSRRNLVF